jgi:phage baseplate assembly protein W
MAGIDRVTGRPLDGFAHVAQSILVIFSTLLGERIMRRHFGSSAPALLGRLLNAPNILRFFALVSLAIETWEPRFRIARVIPLATSPEDIRLGRFSFAIEGEYRPRGHLGDPTPEGIRRITFAANDNGLRIQAA